jgi:hypothetical protein
MRHRCLVALVTLVLASTWMVVPAGGQPPPPSGTASVTFTQDGGCTVTVTYTWSGFKGRDLVAHYGVRWAGPGGTVFGIHVQAYPVTGSGTASHTFDLTGHGQHTYYGGGQLLTTKGKTVVGSEARSATDASLDC